MKTEIFLFQLQTAILNTRAAILYQPFQNEVDYADSSFPLLVPANNLTLPSAKKSDPFFFAHIAVERYKDTFPFILIPGNRFDMSGARQGRGGGWYDRFLSSVPRSWLRTGIAHRSQFSFESIAQQTWDENMDWVIVRDEHLWEAYKTT